MSQVVLVKTSTPRADIGDMIAIQTDTVELSGRGYEAFTILQFSMSVSNLREIVSGKQPDIIREPGKIEVETSPGFYEEISRTPKYRCNFNSLTVENIEELKTSDKVRSTTIFNNRLISCVINQLDRLRV